MGRIFITRELCITVKNGSQAANQDVFRKSRSNDNLLIYNHLNLRKSAAKKIFEPQ